MKRLIVIATILLTTFNTFAQQEEAKTFIREYNYLTSSEKGDNASTVKTPTTIFFRSDKKIVITGNSDESITLFNVTVYKEKDNSQFFKCFDEEGNKLRGVLNNDFFMLYLVEDGTLWTFDNFEGDRTEGI